MPMPTGFCSPNASLLGEVENMLADGRSVMLKATGNSMLPFIVGGRDSVLVRRPSGIQALQVWQIALGTPARQPVCAAPYRPHPWRGDCPNGRRESKGNGKLSVSRYNGSCHKNYP
ncbi:hypothetical protein [Phocaeicola vulgatus]|uniref:hypothetical protein n=1 Tax=Phocaeicola vulgatus TaxID=821 RepID=UPI0021658C71|nr:hypothetical protein [Phocaeicola vulgatus]MCS3105152.1 hypothetical protein [Phocaeicola vulgatus]